MKIVSILIILIFFYSCSFSFFELKFPQTIPNVQKQKNTIQHKISNTNAHIKQNTKLKEQQNTQKTVKNKEAVKIAFIGDSHLASDYISAYFRKKLNINSLGFIQPILPKWHNQYLAHYNNKNFKISYLINTKDNLSFGGVNATCIYSCLVDIALSFQAKKLEQLYWQNSKWQIKKISNNTKHIYFTSFYTLGGFLSNNDEYIDNLGINGASVYNYLRVNNNLVKAIAKKLDYSILIFSFGTNEGVAKYVNKKTFLESYKKIISLFKTQNSKIVLLIAPEPTLYENQSYKKGENADVVKKLIYDLAKELNCYVFDIDLLMQKDGGKKAWINSDLSLKNTHLSKKGYDFVAQKLLEYLKDLNLIKKRNYEKRIDL